MLALLSLLSVVTTGWGWLAAKTRSGWSRVEGVIIESRAHSNCSSCAPIINYRYIVNGQSFVGDRINLSQDSDIPTGAAGHTNAYSMGQKIAIYYDPANPASSCLEPGAFRCPIHFFFAMGTLFSGAGFYLFRALSRVRSR